MPIVNAQHIRHEVIVVGASAGGVEALTTLFAALPEDLPAVVGVVLHRSPLYNIRLGAVLGRRATMPVIEPEPGVSVKPGVVYLAPRDHHMEFRDGAVHLHRGPREHFTRPAIDPLFISAALAYRERVVGVLLSGAGDDGVSGLIEIKAAGGVVVVQDPAEAKVPSMPRSAVIHDHVDLVLPLAKIASALVELAHGRSLASDAQ